MKAKAWQVGTDLLTDIFCKYGKYLPLSISRFFEVLFALWKISAKQIGCLLHEDGTMARDLKTKRAIFINEETGQFGEDEVSELIINVCTS